MEISATTGGRTFAQHNTKPHQAYQPAVPTLGRFFYWGRRMNTRLKFSANNGVRHHDNDNKKGTIRPLDHSDPRSPDHPCHKKQWLELARVLGRLEAREEYAMTRDNDER
jgi:hypothetical protein